MKKSFMTRALATGLSLAMAFSLSAATNVTTAAAAVKPAMKSSKINLEVGQTKNYHATAATKKAANITISKVKISNAAKAELSVKRYAKKKYIAVTGIAATASTRNVVVTFKNSKTKKTTKVTMKATVKEAEQPEQPVEEALAISEVKQTASNAITVTFNKDVSKEVKADNLTIVSDDVAARQIAVKSVTFSADGKSANVVVFGNFVDGTSYKVTYTTLEGKFPASVGAVASVVINTTEAQQNVATPIDFQLFDANGIDVTPSISLDAYTYMSISGNYATADISKPSTAKITLSTIGMTATVTVTYSSGTADAQPISATQEIKCVDAQAVNGNVLFAVLDKKEYTDSAKINKKSGAAKFYQKLGDTSAKVGVADTPSYIFFCATDKGDVISYDSYTVESTNDNIVSVDVAKNNNGDGAAGKYAIIEAQGNSVGAAQILVTASKNGKTSSYIIPVTTYQAGVATKMTVEVSRDKMSNANDTDYYSTITAKLYDAADNPVKGTFTAEVGNVTASSPAAVKAIGNTVNVDKGTFEFNAWNAKGKLYPVTIKGSDNVDNSKAQTVIRNINVSELPEKLANITYQLESTDKSLDMADETNRTTKVRLYANSNGLFAGYVRKGQEGQLGGKTIPASAASASQIQAVSVSAIFNTVKFDVTGGACDLVTTTTASALALAPDANAIYEVNFKTVSVSNGAVLARTDGKGTIARLGDYKVRFELLFKDSNVATKTPEAGFTVVNSYVPPTVSVLSTKIDKTITNDQTVIEAGALSTNVDMNNNTSNYESIDNLYGANIDNGPLGTPTNGRMTARYASVEDDVVVGETWIFYIPISATFVQN